MKIFKNSNYKRLFAYLKSYKKYIIAGFICVLLSNLPTLADPMILGHVVDSIRIGTTLKGIIMPGILLILIELFGGFFKYLMRQTIIKSSRLMEFDMRNDLFSHLQKQGTNFFQHNRTGDILSRAISDVNTVRLMIGPGILNLSSLVVTLFFGLTMMIYINFQLTIISIIPLTFLSIIARKLGSKIHEHFRIVQEQYADLTAKVQENIAGIRVIKAYTQEKNEIKDFVGKNNLLLNKNMKMFKLIGIFHSSFRLFGGIAGAIMLWYGGLQVILHKITLGEFVAFLSYLAFLIYPMIALGWVINLFQRGLTSMKRLNFIYDAAPDIADKGSPMEPEEFSSDILIKNLEFTYNQSKEPVLKSINLTIKKGSSLAIIGHTGSGKSTLVNLIPRIFDPPTGSIFIDGIDILDIPLKKLRDNIGFVSQETFLFSDTIEENIKSGAHYVDSIDEVKKIATFVRLKEEIESFKDGFNSVLGERGINLSGGQKQRMAIARALMKKPSILILDDPFSSVDTSTEDDILKNLKETMKSRTTIMISHRISSIKDCDLIAVLFEGRIAQLGSHEELMQTTGIYSDLYKKQLLQDALEKWAG
jgi:ATP-binding cassette, subfamily B, multidrug efflux pump